MIPSILKEKLPRKALLALCLLFVFALSLAVHAIRQLPQVRAEMALQGIEKAINFQGLVLDSAALGVVLISAIEINHDMQVRHVVVARVGSQQFFEESYQHHAGGFDWLKLNQVTFPVSSQVFRAELVVRMSAVYFLLASVLAAAITLIVALALKWLARSHRMEMERAYQQRLVEISHQVAHDIRSPLAALDMVLKQMQGLPAEQRRLVHGAAARIHDIANGLLHRAPGEGATASARKLPELLCALVEEIVAEKRMQLLARQGIRIELLAPESARALFVDLPPGDCQRVLSNLLNNSAEAMPEGVIQVSVGEENGRALVTVKDNGKGIPPEILARLGKERISHGKDGGDAGSGLGLFHAAKSVAAWGGTLEIQSTPGTGTSVRILLPRAEPPGWFADPGTAAPGPEPLEVDAVLLDDDPLVRQTWALAAKGKGVRLLCFGECAELLRRAASFPRSTPIYLDSDLREENARGEEIAKELFRLGFRELYLATGNTPEGAPPPACFRAVLGKDPPWR